MGLPPAQTDKGIMNRPLAKDRRNLFEALPQGR